MSPEFEKIYRLAKEKNEIKLTELLAQGLCVDVMQGLDTPETQGLYTPAALLAKEWDEAAVKLLIKLGASLAWIMRELAVRGEVLQVEEYLSKHKDSKN